MAFEVAVDQLEVQLLHPDARPPARGRPGDAAYDLSCVESFVLRPGERRMVPTGVAVVRAAWQDGGRREPPHAQDHPAPLTE